MRINNVGNPLLLFFWYSGKRHFRMNYVFGNANLIEGHQGFLSVTAIANMQLSFDMQAYSHPLLTSLNNLQYYPFVS
jgi:hypothetical protein